jgi:hypothetical protein
MGGAAVNQMTIASAPGTGEPTPHIEDVGHNGVPLARIIRASLRPDETTFLTPPEFLMQVGFVGRPAGGEVIRHVHRPIARQLTTTAEVLFVMKGRCLMDVYNDARELIATRELQQGDVLLFLGGGHGFRMLEPTVFLEIKQGPYTGIDEKERF